MSFVRVRATRSVVDCRVARGLSVLAIACSGTDAPTSSAAGESPPESGPAAAESAPTAPEPPPAAPGLAQENDDPSGASPAEFRAPWCEGPGLDPRDRLLMMDSIASGYERQRMMDCQTAGLLPELTDLQRMDWLDYLIGYSTALAGCPPLPVLVPGGILEFGPANTAAIGLPRSPLGSDDVDRLIAQYLGIFSAALGLTIDERGVVEAHLRLTADDETDPSASSVLSTCP